MDFLQEELDEILNIFSQESAEILQSMDKNLLLLEKKPNNPDVAMHLFRDAHSLKGSARMLGFVGIQNIAHKIEDVLGLIREEKLAANSQIADTISAALSCIDMLIKKTIEQKSEFKSEEGELHIQKLAAICEGTNGENQKNYFVQDFLTANFAKFEDLITGVVFLFSKSAHEGDLEQFNDIITIIGELSGFCEQLKNIELYNISMTMLDLAAQSSREENKNEEILYELNIKINEFLQLFNHLAREKGLVPKNYYENVYKISSDSKLIETNNTAEESKQDLKSAELLELINKTVLTITDITKNKHSLIEVKSLLNEIVSRMNDQDFKKIYQNVLAIILNFEKSSVKPEADSIEAVKEILKSTGGIIEAKANKTSYNDFSEEIDLLKQKAVIAEQIVKYELQNPNNVSKSQSSITAADWVQSFDTNSIKTLRVNSDKLDKLASQIGNLIATRIKSHENIGTVKLIQDELLEWQKHYRKIGYYMKFYEKKYIQESSDNTNTPFQKKDGFLSYNKQLITFHNANAEHVNSILNHLNFLMKELQENNIKLNTTTAEIENMVKSMRVLPLSTIFNLFPRMVHNIAKDKGKEIELIIEGQEVSADKKIIEDIKIPIMHIVRNSIDHGIELPREREHLGKDKTGVIIIKAGQKENKITISIKDDGRGINIKKIKTKAIEKGLISKEAAENMPKEQLANFIFYPGFSTGESVTELSGRGFGLDIVHAKISQLNGRIDVYSEENKGTVVTMELSITMATMKAFIIKENGQLFAIAAANIQTVLRISPNEIKKRDEHYYFIYNDQAVPICSLASVLDIKKKEEKPADKFTIMVIKAESVTMGIIVQKLIGDEEILNKKLPEPMLRVKNISGIATLANGEMCLLLNIGDILNSGKIISKEFNNTTKKLILQNNSKYKILIVDDSVTTRRLLVNVLFSKGYKAETESNAKAALELLEANNYDLVITDYEMPLIDGLEFVKILRAKEKTKNVPVFVLTSVEKFGLREEFLNLGVQEFMKKEYFDQQSFIKLINKHLNISIEQK